MSETPTVFPDKENTSNIPLKDKNVKELSGTQRKKLYSPRRSALSKLKDVFSPVKYKPARRVIEEDLNDFSKEPEKEKPQPTFEEDIALKIAEFNKRLSKNSEHLDLPSKPMFPIEGKEAPSFQYSTVSFRTKTPPKICLNDDDLFTQRKPTKRSSTNFAPEVANLKKRRMSSGNTRNIIITDASEAPTFQKPILTKSLTQKNVYIQEPVIELPKGSMKIEDLLACFVFSDQNEDNVKSFIHAYSHFNLTPKAKFKKIWGLYQNPPTRFILDHSKMELKVRAIKYVSLWIRVAKKPDFNFEYSGDSKDNRVPLRYLNNLSELAKTDGINIEDYEIDITQDNSDIEIPIPSSVSRRKSLSRRRSSLGNRRFQSISRSRETILIDPFVFAVQLTYYELRLFKSIKREELMNQAWNRSDADINAPNLHCVIKHFNKLSSWITKEVSLTDGGIKEQIKKIEKFIMLGRKLKNIGNYNGLMEVISGLSSMHVQRLPAWRQIGDKFAARFKKLENLMTPLNNFRQYRHKADNLKTLFLPYVGVHLGDIVHLMEGYADACKGEYEASKVVQLGTILAQWRAWQEQEIDIEEDSTHSLFFHNLNKD